MFFYYLRQVHIVEQTYDVRVEYRCSTCNRFVEVFLEKQEYIDLKNGIPFRFAIARDRQVSLSHFSKGKCNEH